MGHTWVLSAPDGPHEPYYQGRYPHFKGQADSIPGVNKSIFLRRYRVIKYTFPLQLHIQCGVLLSLYVPESEPLITQWVYQCVFQQPCIVLPLIASSLRGLIYTLSKTSYRLVCGEQTAFWEDFANEKCHCIPGPRLNIKTVLSTYGDFHVKDKTAVRTSYL